MPANQKTTHHRTTISPLGDKFERFEWWGRLINHEFPSGSKATSSRKKLGRKYKYIKHLSEDHGG